MAYSHHLNNHLQMITMINILKKGKSTVLDDYKFNLIQIKFNIIIIIIILA